MEESAMQESELKLEYLFKYEIYKSMSYLDLYQITAYP